MTDRDQRDAVDQVTSEVLMAAVGALRAAATYLEDYANVGPAMVDGVQAARAGRVQQGVAQDVAVLLSPRELMVVQMLMQGSSTEEVAERLRISIPTTKNHVQAIFRKLGARSRVEAIAIAAGRAAARTMAR